jgi:hypothetical protein
MAWCKAGVKRYLSHMCFGDTGVIFPINAYVSDTKASMLVRIRRPNASLTTTHFLASCLVA